jgi:hypothetical protein
MAIEPTATPLLKIHSILEQTATRLLKTRSISEQVAMPSITTPQQLEITPDYSAKRVTPCFMALKIIVMQLLRTPSI